MIENKYVRRDPEFVAQALAGVDILDYADSKLLGVATSADGTSYDMLAQPIDEHNVNLLGFFAPESIGINYRPLPTLVTNVNDIYNLPHNLRHIDRTDKGVGGRLYSSIDAFTASCDRNYPAALYAVKVDMQRIFDARHLPENRVPSKIGHFIGEIAQVWNLMTKGADVMVERAEQRYGPDCHAAIWSQPVSPYKRSVATRDGTPPTFALIRHKGHIIRYD